MTAGLSQLSQFVERARDCSVPARAALLRDLADLYLTQPNALSEKARRGFDAVMATLCSQADAQTRREVAEKILVTPSPPKQLLLTLARAEISIAAPLLRDGLAFSDQDLVAMVAEGDPDRLAAIAGRKRISEPLADALAARGDAKTQAVLVKNQGAALSAVTTHTLVNAARKRPELQKPLTTRYDLPPNVLIRMFFFVAPDLRKEILARAGMIEPALVRDAMDATRDSLLIPAQIDGAEAHEARSVIQERAARDAIDEAFLKELLAARERPAILLAFAYITGVDFRAAQMIFKDASLESLAVACRASKLSREMFEALAPLAGKTSANDMRAPVMLDLYEKISPEIAERLMRFWRLHARAAADSAKIASLLRGVEGLSAAG
jgi:uncharacterized protein (DUF2336 family)